MKKSKTKKYDLPDEKEQVKPKKEKKPSAALDKQNAADGQLAKVNDMGEEIIQRKPTKGKKKGPTDNPLMNMLFGGGPEETNEPDVDENDPDYDGSDLIGK